MWFGVVSIFPEMFKALEAGGITKRAREKKLVDWALINPRDFALDPYQTVDDRPYGGGPGMVLKAEPLARALRVAKLRAPEPPKVICLSPSGTPLNQAKVEQLKEANHLVLVSGRYEGIDQRFIDKHVDEEISVGDYVLSGGELPAMLLMDAIIRLLPGAVSTEASVEQESFQQNRLDWPQYTRPPLYEGVAVPEVLLSGDHQAIDAWRKQQALERTRMRRPDLIDSGL